MKPVFAVLLSALLTWGGAVGAEVFQWTSTGYVQFVSGSTWDGTVMPGASFTSTLIYDTSLAATFPPGTTDAQYYGPPVSATLMFGDYSFHFTTYDAGFAPRIEVFNNHTLGFPVDGYTWHWSTPETQYGLNNPFVQGWLLTGNTALLNNADLNLQNFPITAFNEQHDHQLSGYDASGNRQTVDFITTGYFITPVPEPSASALGLAVLLVLLFGGLRTGTHPGPSLIRVIREIRGSKFGVRLGRSLSFMRRDATRQPHSVDRGLRPTAALPRLLRDLPITGL